MSKNAEQKKLEIIDVIHQYVNNGVIDMSKLRNEHPSVYSSLPYYFGGVEGMLTELNLVKVEKSKNKVTLKNRLAYDYLTNLREKYTLEQIATMYGVTRALINQQYQALDIAIKTDKLISEKSNKN